MITPQGQKVTNINYSKIKRKKKEPKVEFEPDFNLD
jgi:hypothetical protein